MKKFLVFLLLAVFALSAATPAFAYHHRRHYRYHEGRYHEGRYYEGRPVVVFRY